MTTITAPAQTDAELSAAVMDGYAALVRQNPAMALAALEEFAQAFSDAEFGFAPLVPRIAKSSGNPVLTLDGKDVQVIAVDSATRLTRAEGVLTENRVRFDFPEADADDYEPLAYVVEVDGEMVPVRLPQGWKERIL